MFGIAWVYESALPTANFMKNKYRSSISNEKLVSGLRFAVNVKYTSDFKDTV